MLTKEQHIAHWLKTSEDDEITMHLLFEGGQYTHSLFFGHLYLEKICKALWVRNNTGNTPPFIHNLVKLLPSNVNETGLSDSDMLFLDNLNAYQLSGRYPEYTHALKRKTTKEFTANCIKSIKSISECLRKKI